MHVNDKELSAYVDNSLPAEKQNQLKEHFSVCGECRRRLNEWECLFDTIGMLNFDFSLEGLEEKVLQRIRKEGNETVTPRVLVSHMAYVMVFLFLASLFISPVTRLIEQSLQYVGEFLFGAGIGFINDIKWHAVDIVAFIQSINLSSWLFLLVAGITLIAGGSYFSFGSRLRKA
jgi:hypothetical protein